MFLWNEQLSVGVKELDDQHQHLFDLINELLVIAENRHEKDADKLIFLLNQLINYNLYHLSAEEEYMIDFDCKSALHFAAHESYRGTIRRHETDVITALAEKSEWLWDRIKELVNYTGSWHMDHIVTTDQKYTKCFHDHGLY